MDVLQRYWISILAVVLVALLLFISVVGVIQTSTGTPVEDEAPTWLFVLVGLVGVGFLVGLWLLRSGGSGLLANVLVVLGLIQSALFFWLFFIPVILALVVLWFGVVKGGLAAELRPTDVAPQPS